MAREMCELRVFAINNMIVVKCFPNSFIFISPVSGSHFDCNCDDGMWVVYGYEVEEEEELLFPSSVTKVRFIIRRLWKEIFSILPSGNLYLIETKRQQGVGGVSSRQGKKEREGCVTID